MKVICVSKGFRFTYGKIYDAVNFSSMAESGTPICLFDDVGQMQWFDLEKIDFLVTLEGWREGQLNDLEI